MNRPTREIRQRWIITGALELLTPTHLSNGDADFEVDLPLLTDPYDRRPLLTGASLAGALRNYINEYYDNFDEDSWLEKTYQDKKKKKINSQTEWLFGAARGDDDGDQSPLIVHDALGKKQEIQIERRDGVRIDPKTRTAADQAKFDLNLLAAGTQFGLCFELIITAPMLEKIESVKQTLALALHGLQTEQIPLGGRKRRGYGACRAKNWQLWQFDLTKAEGLKGWLAFDYQANHNAPPPNDDILSLLTIELPTDKRQQFELDASFAIDGSVLIRSGFEADFSPDMAHLESRRRGEMVPILSGTSLAGVIRGQALRIAHTVSGDEALATKFINNLFGFMSENDNRKAASRVTVKETEIIGGQRLVQNRVAIDRFTGGALESALFSEQPVFGGQARLQLVIKRPKEEEIGVLLLALKDLWTGFLPVGGEVSVGRGRLKGKTATIKHGDDYWELDEKRPSFVNDNAEKLESYVAAFVQKMKGGAS